MRRAILAAAACVLLAGPTAVAFFAGGYAPPFEISPDRWNSERWLIGISAWALVLVAAVLSERPLPRRAPGRVALAGLAGLAAWTGLSITWAPLADPAGDDLQRLLLYVAVFTAAIALLRAAAVRRALEPVLAGGALVVICTGLSERVLPRVFELERSVAAGGRLDQPLTYWNGMGALGAIGTVLALRVAGDSTRPALLRAAAAAGSLALITGTWLSFSRGALAALGIGALALLALAPTRAQLRALLLCVPLGAVCALVADRLDGVRALEGTLSERASDGLVMLAVLLPLAAVAALVQWLLAAREGSGRLSPARYAVPRWAPAAAGVLVAALVAAAVVVAAGDRGPRKPDPTGADPNRLSSFESNRYQYWEAAWTAFKDDPVIGVGSSGFAVVWTREREIGERVREAHSLYIETVAELGIVGGLLLLAFLGGVAAAARRAYRADAAAAAGPIAAVLVWATHATVDWDWELPGVTLPALVLAGALVAAAEGLSGRGTHEDAPETAAVERPPQAVAAP